MLGFAVVGWNIQVVHPTVQTASNIKAMRHATNQTADLVAHSNGNCDH